MSQGLPRVLGRLEATTVVVGSMIGSGVFFKAPEMMNTLPHPLWVLACWAAAGLLTLSGALLIAELSARFPGSGGLYLFLREGFGPLPAFLFGWSLLAILQTGSVASLACALALALDNALGVPAWWLQKIPFLAIAALTTLHCLSVSAGTTILNNALTFIKYFAVIALVLMGLFAGQAHTYNLQATDALPSFRVLVAALGLLMLKALWAYDGWANGTFIAGEVREAEKNLPLALLNGTVLVILAYVAVNASCHLVLSPQELMLTKAPAVAVTERCLGSGWGRLTAVLLAVSILGTLNSSILSAPRVYFAMAEAGQFPAFMAATSRFKTPHVSLILQGLWAAMLVRLWGQFSEITDNVVFIFWIFYALCAIAALRFPPPETGYRAPFRPLLAIVFLAGAGLVIGSQLVAAPGSALQALGLLALGLPLYLLRRGSGDSSPNLESDNK